MFKLLQITTSKSFPKYNPPDAFETISALVQTYSIPIDYNMLSSFGKWEGLESKEIDYILTKPTKKAFDLNDKDFREWCLQKIVFILVYKYRRVDGNLYKVLVNLVNALSLSFPFLDKTIEKSKELAKVNIN